MAPRVALAVLSHPLYRKFTYPLAKRDLSNGSSPILFVGIPTIIFFCLFISFFCARQAARRAPTGPAAPSAIYPHNGPNLTCRNVYCSRPNCIRARQYGIVDNHDPHAGYPAWNRSGRDNLASCTESGCMHGHGTCGGNAVELASHEPPVYRPADAGVVDRPPTFGEITDPPPAYVRKVPLVAPE